MKSSGDWLIVLYYQLLIVPYPEAKDVQEIIEQAGHVFDEHFHKYIIAGKCPDQYVKNLIKNILDSAALPIYNNIIKGSASMEMYIRYFWKELTDEGKLKDAAWARPEGYENYDQATIHFHMKFSIDSDDGSHPRAPRYTLMKFYGVK
jgi:hypothetical protein